MSDKQSVNITAKFSNPLWTSDAYSHTFDKMEAYSHEITADGGYKSATISKGISEIELEDWLERGLGRHVEVYDPFLDRVWEGFVNEVAGSIGTLSVTRGPLLNVANRISVTYTPYVDITVDPPTTGVTTETTIEDDEDSQARYGILEEVVNGGTLVDDATYCGSGCVPDNEAEEIRDAYLNEHKNPETSQALSLQTTTIPKLTINCMGYKEFLGKYVYNSDELNTTTIPEKIFSVLAADPNGIFSTDYSGISDSAAYLLLTPQFENQNRTALTIIQELIAQGDAADNRTLFSIYNDRRAYYSAIPSTVEYYHRIKSRDQFITFANGDPIEPWRIRPGKWIFLADFMPGRRFSTILREDPRNMFIESVTYTMPFGISLQGSKIGTVKQLMTKLGVSSG